jgi:hypothetical protein
VAGREFEEYLIDTSRLFLHHRLLSQTAFQAEKSFTALPNGAKEMLSGGDSLAPWGWLLARLPQPGACAPGY